MQSAENGARREIIPAIDRTEIEGKIPESWVWTRLGEIALKVQDGTHYSPKVQHQEGGKGRFLYITSKNIKNYGVELRDATYIERSVHETIFARCNPELGDLLLIKDGFERITGQMSGSAITRIILEKVKTTVVALPPLAEQRRIVAKVDELMALCDELAARQQARHDARARLTQSAFHHLTAAKDATEFRKHSSFCILHSASLPSHSTCKRRLNREIS